MHLNSFRLKIALWAGLVTAALLLGSELVLWRVAYRFNLNRLDHEIRNVGTANLDRVVGGDHWARLEAALAVVAGEQPTAKYVLWVKNYDRVVFKSPDWPAEITPASFPVSSRYEGGNTPTENGQPPVPPRRGEEISSRNPALPRRVASFHTVEADGRTWRVGAMGNPYVTLIVGADIAEFNASMNTLRRTFLATVPAVLLLATGGAWLVARRALDPVSTLSDVAERITAQGLDQRIPEMVRDQEFNRLVSVFNAMLDRLETSFGQATRFSADASHELKTPLARLQLELEQALETAASDPAQQAVYGSLLEEVSRLKAIVQKLLLLSLADAGRLQLHLTVVDLSVILSNVAEDSRAATDTLAIEQRIPPGIRVRADADLLEQALQNLATNALKYNREGGRVCIDLSEDTARVIVRFTNTGPQIPDADRERIFDRFFRVDGSRSTRSGGAGLGLSLAREIIRAHHGEVLLEASDTTETRFVVIFPLPK